MIKVGTVKVDKVQIGDNWRLIIGPSGDLHLQYSTDSTFTTVTDVQIFPKPKDIK